MSNYREIQGDLIELALLGEFDVIAHGVNCQCVQGAGIAKRMVEVFETNKFSQEQPLLKGKIDKLGNIEYRRFDLKEGKAIPTDVFTYQSKYDLTVINAYTQFNYGKNHVDGTTKPLDYEALTLCMKKINHNFKGQKIGLPQIGAGLGGGNWNKIKSIIQNELVDCDITIVIYNK